MLSFNTTDPIALVDTAFSGYASMAQEALLNYLWRLPGTQAKLGIKSKLGDMLATKINSDLIIAADETLEVCNPLSPHYLYSNWEDVWQSDSDTLKHTALSKIIGLAEGIVEGYAASGLLAGIQYMAPQALVAILPSGIFAQALNLGGPLACAILVHSARKMALGSSLAENFRLHNYSKFDNPFGIEAIRKRDLDRFPEVSERLRNAQENIAALIEPIANNVLQIELYFHKLKTEKLKPGQRRNIEDQIKSQLKRYEKNINTYNAAILDLRDGFELLDKLNKAQFKAKAKDYDTVKDNLSKAQSDIEKLSLNLQTYKKELRELQQHQEPNRRPVMEFSKSAPAAKARATKKAAPRHEGKKKSGQQKNGVQKNIGNEATGSALNRNKPKRR